MKAAACSCRVRISLIAIARLSMKSRFSSPGTPKIHRLPRSRERQPTDPNPWPCACFPVPSLKFIIIRRAHARLVPIRVQFRSGPDPRETLAFRAPASKSDATSRQSAIPATYQEKNSLPPALSARVQRTRRFRRAARRRPRREPDFQRATSAGKSSAFTTRLIEV